jgi:hypothetical protein
VGEGCWWKEAGRGEEGIDNGVGKGIEMRCTLYKVRHDRTELKNENRLLILKYINKCKRNIEA